MSDVRVSPTGGRIGSLEHPIDGDDKRSRGNPHSFGSPGRVVKRLLRLCWPCLASDGNHLLFGAREAGIGGVRAIFTIGLDGKLALLRRETGNLAVQDITKDGRLLLTRDVKGDEVFGRFGADEKDRWLGWRNVRPPTSLSDDGKYLLLSVQGEMSGPGYQIFLSSTARNDPPVFLGEGMPAALSPNSTSALILYP
jgi:hypothetical protein